MNRFIVLTVLFLAGFVTLSLAETQVITLKDGSQIKGELVSVNGGSYTVRTDTLGEIKVDSSKVASISNPALMPAQAQGNANNPINNNDLNQRIQSAQSKLMSDPQMMTQLQEMLQDPELMELLSDPSLTQAVMSRDVNSIQNNPKAQALMNNPKMRQLMEQLKDK